MKIRIFSPVFNAAESLKILLQEFTDVAHVLKEHGHTIEVLIINDCSTDRTREVLDCAAVDYAWLVPKHNDKNLGNAENIIAGYTWGVRSDVDVVGCMDADGEHSPYALIRHLRMIERGDCDGISGSIIFPDHNANYYDRNMMRFWGGQQSVMAGIDGTFYIQSPGYNVHRRDRVEKALELFDQYKDFFALHATEPFPRWGLHGVMIDLLARGAGSRIKAAYLECFGSSPNRTPEKIFLQADAANTHMKMLLKFLPAE
ncbi:glycosyltransferase [bacterium]|nr:glycosyltransferase [bacterium]MCI0565951.1 glycosyltransferase [bacterium]